MKNIETILSDFGITIPEGKAADLRRPSPKTTRPWRNSPSCRNATTRWTHR